MSPKTREPADRRAAILEAARQLFADKGLDGTRMSDVAGAAKVSKGSLYEVADNKLDLFFLVCKEQLDQEHKRVEEAIAEATDAIDIVRRVLRASVPTCRERPEFYAIIFDLIGASLRHGEFREKVARFYAEIDTKWRRLILGKIQQGIKEGVFRVNLDANLLMEIIHAWIDHNWMEFMLKSDLTIGDIQRRIDLFTESLLQWVTGDQNSASQVK